jgi:hypothetical protein
LIDNRDTLRALFTTLIIPSMVLAELTHLENICKGSGLDAAGTAMA